MAQIMVAQWTVETAPQIGEQVMVTDPSVIPSIPKYALGYVERVGHLKSTGQLAAQVTFTAGDTKVRTVWTLAAAEGHLVIGAHAVRMLMRYPYATV